MPPPYFTPVCELASPLAAQEVGGAAEAGVAAGQNISQLQKRPGHAARRSCRFTGTQSDQDGGGCGLVPLRALTFDELTLYAADVLCAHLHKT